MSAMYEAYRGLREAPFEGAPNPKFLYLSPRHEYTVVVDGLASMPDAMAVTVTLREQGFTHADVATGDGPLAVRLGAPERLWEAVRNGERVRGLGYPVRVIAERAKG